MKLNPHLTSSIFPFPAATRKQHVICRYIMWDFDSKVLISYHLISKHQLLLDKIWIYLLCERDIIKNDSHSHVFKMSIFVIIPQHVVVITLYMDQKVHKLSLKIRIVNGERMTLQYIKIFLEIFSYWFVFLSSIFMLFSMQCKMYLYLSNTGSWLFLDDTVYNFMYYC